MRNTRERSFLAEGTAMQKARRQERKNLVCCKNEREASLTTVWGVGRRATKDYTEDPRAIMEDLCSHGNKDFKKGSNML